MPARNGNGPLPAQLFIRQFEPAHNTAEHAATLGTGLDSARVRRRHRDLARKAASYPADPLTREIHDLLTADLHGRRWRSSRRWRR